MATLQKHLKKSAVLASTQSELVRKKSLPVVALQPISNAAAIAEAFTVNTFGQLDAPEAIAELAFQVESVRLGDLQQIEAMLVSQAHSLDVLFASLARRSAVNMSHDLTIAEACMKLALRAQNQCRATLETLAGIKNPPLVFAKQANISHGHQQVNNSASRPARGKKTAKMPNELMESDDGEWMDGGASGATGTLYPTMEAVGTGHGATHSRG